MTLFKEKYGDWALIAGAAEGLGEAYSRSLAKRGMNLLMLDHQEEQLNRLADEIEIEFGVNTQRIFQDLGSVDATDILISKLASTSCRLVVYNAAYSKVKKFTEHSREDLEKYITINMRTPILLLHEFVSLHIDDASTKKGIILMSSLAGAWGTKYLAPYGATKAFNRILGEALHAELKPANIDVMTCVAGATATPAYLQTNPSYGKLRPHVMDPMKVTEEVLDKLGRRTVYIPGWRNRFTYFLLNRILPRSISLNMFNKTVGDMYRKV